MKKFLSTMLMVLTLGTVAQTEESMPTEPTNVYGFSFKTLYSDKPMPLSEYKGKVLLIVNTASECGFTPQFAALETLYKAYEKDGLVIVGVPSNDFGNQEPGNEEAIANFCRVNYGVTFPMTAKEVVTGEHAHPFYIWAREQLGFGSAPKWNFHKYLIGRDGTLINYYYSTTAPDSKKVKNAIEAALADKAV